ncbi:MAG: hypothetical protein WCI63_04640 [bacterium]
MTARGKPNFNIFQGVKEDLGGVKGKFTKKSNNKTKITKDRSKLWGKIGFALGLIGVVGWIYPVIGLPVLIAGLVFNILGLKAVKGRWFSVAGLTLSIFFLNLAMIYHFYYYMMSLMFGGVK